MQNKEYFPCERGLILLSYQLMGRLMRKRRKGGRTDLSWRMVKVRRIVIFPQILCICYWLLLLYVWVDGLEIDRWLNTECQSRNSSKGPDKHMSFIEPSYISQLLFRSCYTISQTIRGQGADTSQNLPPSTPNWENSKRRTRYLNPCFEAAWSKYRWKQHSEELLN